MAARSSFTVAQSSGFSFSGRASVRRATAPSKTSRILAKVSLTWTLVSVCPTIGQLASHLICNKSEPPRPKDQPRMNDGGLARLERAPTYRLVYDAIEREIVSGRLKVGDPL